MQVSTKPVSSALRAIAEQFDAAASNFLASDILVTAHTTAAAPDTSVTIGAFHVFQRGQEIGQRALVDLAELTPRIETRNLHASGVRATTVLTRLSDGVYDTGVKILMPKDPGRDASIAKLFSDLGNDARAAADMIDNPPETVTAAWGSPRQHRMLEQQHIGQRF